MINQPKPTLGRLQPVQLRDAWLSEASDFTPWLALPENIALLSEAIGIELEVESVEKNVGPFRADILCRATLSNHYVLVENQLERTDHTHLGQLLTYVAGLAAVTIVWVAGRFTEEHRAALDWLNASTTTGINFFGLEIELWRIGNSDLAPKFNVISKPNDWTKAVQEQATAAQSGDLTPFQRLHLEFWTQFREFIAERSSPVGIGRPSTSAWTDVAVGRTFFTLQAWNSMRDSVSGVNLQIHGPDAKAHFGLIEQRYRDDVEARLSGLGTLEWRLLPKGKENQIRIWRKTTPTNPATWPELDAWMPSVLEPMDGLFRPIVKTLDATEFQSPLVAADDLSDDPASADA